MAINVKPKPTDSEVLEIINAVFANKYKSQEEEQEKLMFLDYYYPGISNLMFKDKRNLTPEEILEEAKKKKPIILGPGPGQ